MNTFKKFAYGVLGGAMLLPAFAFAQQNFNFDPIINIVLVIQRIINLAIPIAVSLALLYFIYGLAQFILKSGSEDAKEEGRRKMIWGILALFVVVSVWGITGFLARIFGVESRGEKVPPPGVITPLDRPY